jgi:hypothetical protein
MSASVNEVIGYRVDEAVLLLQGWFHRKACGMTRDNRSLIEDLVQEMSMGVLSCKGEHPLQYYKVAGITRARMFLRAEARQAMRRSRFALLKHTVTHQGEIGFVEGLIDLHDSINSRPEAPAEFPELTTDIRKSA